MSALVRVIFALKAFLIAMTSAPPTDRWALSPRGHAGILWNVEADMRLPHEDHIEMSGRRVSMIVRYGADADRNVALSREIIWPMLRTKPRDVRGYLRRTYGPEVVPRLTVDGRPFVPGPLARVRFDGVLTL